MFGHSLRTHVAGIIDMAEAELLIECGVDALGFPLVLDHHTEDLTVREASAIVERLGDRAHFFLITYLEAATGIGSLCRELGVSTVQLHGDVAVDEIKTLREQFPEIAVIKSLIVRDGNADELEHAVSLYEPVVDAFLTDTYCPTTGATGATGRSHDWSVSRSIAELSEKPLILAGGLRPTNVYDAITTVQPAAVDAHTGLEGPDGRKHADLVAAFVEQAHAAFAEADR